jgi:hypothetical protein
MTENPFEDIEKAIGEAVARQLELVKELDEMDIDVTPWEADFLNNVMIQLGKKTPLTQPQLDVLHRMCNQYDIECGDFFDDKK